MRTASLITLLFGIPLVFSPQLAVAEVFKCTTADGKTSYSETPCMAADAKEAVVPILASPAPNPATPGRNWAAENAAANARAFEAASRPSAAASSTAQKASAPAKSAKQIAAECEANRGVDCDSSREVAQREADQRTLTADEEAARQRAAAGRRERERAEADAKVKPKPKP